MYASMKTMAFRPRAESFAAKCPVEAPAAADLALSRAMSSSDVCHLSMPPRIKKWNESFAAEQPSIAGSGLSAGRVSRREVDARRAFREQRRADMLAAAKAYGHDAKLVPMPSMPDVGLSSFSEDEDAQKAALMISASLTEAGDAHFQHTFALGMDGRPSIGLAGRDPAAERLMMQGVGVAEMTDDEKVASSQMQRM
jgi:hypothetical protein